MMSKEPTNASKNTLVPIGELPAQISLLEPQPIIRPEYNIGKYAGIIFASPYAKNLDEPLEHTWEIEVDQTSVSAALVVTPKYGKKRPTTTTLRVLLALLQLWTLRGQPEDGIVEFSSRQLAGIIGWRWSGRDTSRRIADHIEILRATSLTWRWAFKRPEGDTARLMTDTSILQRAEYVERSAQLPHERSKALHTARFTSDLVENMLAGHVRPINYDAVRSISNDTSLNLYTRIDIYLSSKSRWERRSEALFAKELGLVGKRYEQRRIRLAQMKRFINELDGVSLFQGKLKLWYEKTADGEDYKLIAVKIPDAPTNPPPTTRALKRLVDSDMAKIIAEDLIEAIEREPNAGTPRLGYVTYLCELYPETLLYRALGNAKADYRGKVRKTLSHVFFYELKQLVRDSKNYVWYKDVPKKDVVK